MSTPNEGDSRSERLAQGLAVECEFGAQDSYQLTSFVEWRCSMFCSGHRLAIYEYATEEDIDEALSYLLVVDLDVVVVPERRDLRMMSDHACERSGAGYRINVVECTVLDALLDILSNVVANMTERGLKKDV